MVYHHSRSSMPEVWFALFIVKAAVRVQILQNGQIVTWFMNGQTFFAIKLCVVVHYNKPEYCSNGSEALLKIRVICRVLSILHLLNLLTFSCMQVYHH